MQTGELIIIAILALVVLGPERLPGMAKKVGGWIAELRNTARDLTAGLEKEMSDLKQVGDELKAPLDEVKKPFNHIRDEVRRQGDMLEWKGPKPLSGPTPEDAMRDYEAIHGTRPPLEPQPTPQPEPADSGDRVDEPETD